MCKVDSLVDKMNGCIEINNNSALLMKWSQTQPKTNRNNTFLKRERKKLLVQPSMTTSEKNKQVIQKLHSTFSFRVASTRISSQ